MEDTVSLLLKILKMRAAKSVFLDNEWRRVAAEVENRFEPRVLSDINSTRGVGAIFHSRTMRMLPNNSANFSLTRRPHRKWEGRHPKCEETAAASTEPRMTRFDRGTLLRRLVARAVQMLGIKAPGLR